MPLTSCLSINTERFAYCCEMRGTAGVLGLTRQSSLQSISSPCTIVWRNLSWKKLQRTDYGIRDSKLGLLTEIRPQCGVSGLPMHSKFSHLADAFADALCPSLSYFCLTNEGMLRTRHPLWLTSKSLCSPSLNAAMAL